MGHNATRAASEVGPRNARTPGGGTCHRHPNVDWSVFHGLFGVGLKGNQQESHFSCGSLKKAHPDVEL